MKKFRNAVELAEWILANIKDELQQEVVMLEGIRNNYTINV